MTQAKITLSLFVERTGKKQQHTCSARTVEELLSQLNQNAQDVIVVRNGEVVLEKEPLAHGDEIKLLSVISGG